MSTLVVAEIGQNHNGHLPNALDLIDIAHSPNVHDLRAREAEGVDAVKFCKRDLDYELSRTQAEQPYRGRHSFGHTYREHREALELSWRELTEAAQHAKDRHLEVGITLCAPTLVDELPFTPDFLKVASRDLTNIPLIRRMARTRLPLILSTGMHGERELGEAMEVAAPHTDVTVLHCVSSYPTEPEEVNLNTIPYLRNLYPDCRIGFSDHTIGIKAAPVAVALGAEVVEKHITLNRQMRGSDHSGALGGEGIWRMVRDIRAVEEMLGTRGMFVEESVRSAREKLERVLCAEGDLEPGVTLGSSNTKLLSAGREAWSEYDGLAPWHDRARIFGHELDERVEANTVLSSTMVA